MIFDGFFRACHRHFVDVVWKDDPLPSGPLSRSRPSRQMPRQVQGSTESKCEPSQHCVPGGFAITQPFRPLITTACTTQRCSVMKMIRIGRMLITAAAVSRLYSMKYILVKLIRPMVTTFI
jgi:hypothetical protein